MEKAAAAGRNGKGGTSSERGNSGPKATARTMAGSLGDQPESGSSEQRRCQEWTPGTHADGGANFDNPRRGVLLPRNRSAYGRKARSRTGSRETGRRRKDCVFVEETKVRRAGPLVDPTPRRAWTGSPSQARIIITRRRSKAKEGVWKRPTIHDPSMC